ncbi:MAG TPA: creatininase family protein [Acidobacteriota bacterium]
MPGALDRLRAFDRLTVGPPQLTPRGLDCELRVLRGGQSSPFALQFRYEEDVFDPALPWLGNLATMIALQVAINYGLFCDEIEIEGPLDPADLKFTKAMLRNTAKEIYINKIAKDNPYLKPEFAHLPFERRKDYLRATLKATSSAPRPWSCAADEQRYAVLSSGGKESLLSYGVLRELGRSVDPIFFNESGRHWFTALKAYRHFKEQVPGTRRVWGNVDRFYAFMLRQLPLIREDFHDLRADVYPIRLYTVAPMLFAALPLILKQGAAHLVIGDEYDTTEYSAYKGVYQYNQLYDQSRYFDDAMSRYFGDKGLALRQFSLLRSLSELLVERVLAERYPDLLALQTSCHATHLDGEQVRPCGNCEKCRRVMAMLLAVGADPTRCGYSAEQAANLPKRLGETALHQEGRAVEHLLFLLQQRGVDLGGLLPGILVPRERPEIEHLRFDNERSFIDIPPRSIRREAYRIFLAHARGSMRLVARKWERFDLLSSEEIGRPSGERVEAPEAPTEERFLLREMSWVEAREALKRSEVALLPVGSIEQHGPHLPLDTDLFDVERMCLDVATRAAAPKPLVLPPLPYGVAYHHKDFPGTIWVEPGTLAAMVYDVGKALAHHGIRKLVIINGHGGNVPALNFAAQRLNHDLGMFICVDTGDTSAAEAAALIETPNDVHAGEEETSTQLALRPQLVRMDLAKRAVPRFPSRYLDYTQRNKVEWYIRTAKISSSGVLGDPTKASVEKGEKLWQKTVDNMVEFVQELQKLDLDELTKKR